MSTQPIADQLRTEIVILGSSFSGALLAWILARAGRDVVVVDPVAHPRFALGESSTPLADLILEKIAERYALPELKPLARWGTWQTQHADLRAGKKRGFAYFRHRPGQPFVESEDHDQSLLVAASDCDEKSDVQWLRKDVDHWFSQQAVNNGALLLCPARCRSVQRAAPGASAGGRWSMRLLCGEAPQAGLGTVRLGSECTVHCDVIIDASGGAGVLGHEFQIPSGNHALACQNACLFGHFREVGDGKQLLIPPAAKEWYPFDPDDSAQHHLIEGGWFWMLRFSEGTCSVGMVGRPQFWTGLPTELANQRGQVWDGIINNYPSLKAMLESARLVDPGAAQGQPELGWMPRISRMWNQAAGEGWFMLPTTAGVIDPLHSTGIAHALSGVWRIAALLTSQREGASEYSMEVTSEIRWIDELVACCYEAQMVDFDWFVAATTLYFLAAIHCERSLAWEGDMLTGFLQSQSRELRVVVQQFRQKTGELVIAKRESGSAAELTRRIALEIEWLRTAVACWNDVGLLEPGNKNRIAKTVAPK